MATPAAVLAVVVQAKGITTVNKQLQGVHGSLGKAGDNALKMGDDLDKGAKKGSRAFGALKAGAGLAAGAIGVVGLAGAIKSAVGEFEEARKVGAQTNAVIKSTGGVANVSATHVAKLSGAISKKVGIDDEAIQSGANLLLTFKNVRNETGKGRDIFDQATKAAVDLSAAGFGGLSSTSKQLGKALNDPVKGMTALSRSGVTFSEKQQATIEALLATGKAADRVKAQQLILREVQSQVGGSAAAQATSLDKLKVTMGNIAEAAGAVLVPAFDKAAQFLTKLLNQMIEGRSIGGAIISVFKATGGVIGTLVGAVSNLIGWFKQHETVALALGAAIGVLVAAFTAMKIIAAVQAAIVALRGAMLALNASFLANPITLLVVALAALVGGIVVAYRESETFRNIVDGAWDVIKKVAAWLITAGVDAFTAVSDAVETAWGIVKTVTETVWGTVRAVVTGVVGGILTYFGNAWDDIKAGWRDAWGVVRSVTHAVWDAIGPYLTGIWNAIKTVVTTYFDVYKTIILGAWRVIRDTTSAIWTFVKDHVLAPVWGAIKVAAGVAWDGIRLAILDPVRAARDRLADIWNAIKDVGETAWGGIKKAWKAVLEPVADVILAPFRFAARQVGRFAKLILTVIEKIPGVGNEKIDAAKGAIDDLVNGLARGGVHGGAFARTGGLVNGPITLMGEEAPRHPEFVIPTNPAYRKRAQGLLAQAAGAVGFAEGGVIEAFRSAIGSTHAPPKAQVALFEAGLVESGLRNLPYGDADSRGALQIRDATARGMGINNMSPLASALAFLTRGFWGKGGAISLSDTKNSAGWVAQMVQGSAFPERYDQVFGQAVAYLTGREGGAGFDLLSKLNPLDLIKQLPNPADLLPDWLVGTGKWVVGQAADYIKDTLGGLLGGGHAGGGDTLGILREVARKFGLTISSTFRTVQQNAAAGGVPNSLHTHGSPTHPGAGDLVGPMRAMQEALKWAVAQFHPIEALIHDVGSGMHLHLGFFDKGGVYGGLPFVGSYHSGGVAPREGLAHVAAGEAIGGPLVHIENAQFGSRLEANAMAERLAFRIATNG